MSLPFSIEDGSPMPVSSLKAKGNCCKSGCLHCPYGFTIKKCGLGFVDYKPEYREFIDQALSENNDAKLDWEKYSEEQIQLVTLKDFYCGFIVKNHIIVLEHYLLKSFQEQDLSKELIESYYFY